MPKTKSSAKESSVYVRVTKTIKDLIVYQASQEGVTPSEWLRNLITKELRERKALPTLFKVPEIEEKNTMSE
jgi:hypothetical protein